MRFGRRTPIRRLNHDHRLPRPLHDGTRRTQRVARCSGRCLRHGRPRAALPEHLRRRDPGDDREEPAAPADRARRRHDDLFAARLGDGAPHRRRSGQHGVEHRVQRPDQAGRRSLSGHFRRVSASCRSRPACRSITRLPNSNVASPSWASSAAISTPTRAAGIGTRRRSPTSPGTRSTRRWSSSTCRRWCTCRAAATRTSTPPAPTTSTPTPRRSCSSCRATCSPTSPTCASSSRTAAARCPTTGAATAAWPTCSSKPPLREHVMNNVYFDTCVYHQPGIDLLFKVIDPKNILFGSEMVGAVRGIDPETGHYFDDTKRYIDALDVSAAVKDARVRRQCAAGLSAARCHPREARLVMSQNFQMDADWLPFHPEPVEADVHAAAWRGRRALPRVRSGRRVPLRAGAQVHAVRRRQGAAVRDPRLPRLVAQRHRPGHLSRRRQPGDGRCAATQRTGSRAASPPSSPTSPMTN